MSSPDAPMLEGDFAEGAYGPTILLVLRTVDGVRWLRATFDDLADATTGTVLRLDAEPGVSIGAAVTELNLKVVGSPPPRHLVRDRSGAFLWSGTPEDWRTASLLIEPLTEQPGHQYLTSEIEDDALIEVSFGEHHGHP